MACVAQESLTLLGIPDYSSCLNIKNCLEIGGLSFFSEQASKSVHRKYWNSYNVSNTHDFNY